MEKTNAFSKANVPALREAAQAEADRMLESTCHALPDQRVTMSVEQFRTLADLLQACATLPSKDTRQDEDGFDALVNGVRAWVPMAHHQSALREMSTLRQELALRIQRRPTACAVN